MLHRIGPQHRHPLGEADPAPGDWSPETLVALTVVQLGRREAACGDPIVARWLRDLRFLIDGDGRPQRPEERHCLGTLVWERMSRLVPPEPRKGIDP